MYVAALKKILAEKKYRRVAVIVFIIYTIIYLLVTQFLVITFEAGDNPAFLVNILEGWPGLLFRQRAPFLFESIGIIHLTPYITLAISIPNLILAFALSYLVAMNITVSFYMFRNLGLRGSKGIVSLLGTIPALLGGAACCVPTLIIVLGLQFTATLTTIWPWFVPASFILLGVSLWWVLRQAQKRLEPVQPQQQ